MVNKPLINPYFLGGVALGGVARIPMTFTKKNQLGHPEMKIKEPACRVFCCSKKGF